jgi:hypothetical protein
MQTAPELGAEFLDRVVPGWFWRVETRTLEMQGWGHCVLSQLAGDSSVDAGWAYTTSILEAGHPDESFQDKNEAHAGLRAYGFAPRKSGRGRVLGLAQQDLAGGDQEAPCNLYLETRRRPARRTDGRPDLLRDPVKDGDGRRLNDAAAYKSGAGHHDESAGPDALRSVSIHTSNPKRCSPSEAR